MSSKQPSKKELTDFFDERWRDYVAKEWDGKIPEDREAEILDAFYHGGEAIFDLLKQYVQPIRHE